jgi:hypothetical protein
MTQDGSVFSLMGDAFRLWSAFCEEQGIESNSMRFDYISPRGFVQASVPVPSHLVVAFAKHLESSTDYRVSLIDGDVKPNALWLGHWTQFAIRHQGVPVILNAPSSANQSERFLRRLLNGDIPAKPRRPR